MKGGMLMRTLLYVNDDVLLRVCCEDMGGREHMGGRERHTPTNSFF